MRHASSVRSFYSNPAKEEQVLCAQGIAITLFLGDGGVAAWDTKYKVKIDSIQPDLKW